MVVLFATNSLRENKSDHGRIEVVESLPFEESDQIAKDVKLQGKQEVRLVKEKLLVVVMLLWSQTQEKKVGEERKRASKSVRRNTAPKDTTRCRRPREILAK